jgi:4-hydroxy-3-methylbut-2-enyl diphosphate reductase
VISLSKEVDAMIVVGGRGSANTNRLVEISEKKGVPAFLVETEHELDLRKLAEYGVIGVTAGASTPNWLLERVVDKVQTPGPISELYTMKKLLQKERHGRRFCERRKYQHF